MAEISIPFRCAVCGRSERIRLAQLQAVPTCHGQPMELTGGQDVQQAVETIFRGVSDLLVAALRQEEDA